MELVHTDMHEPFSVHEWVLHHFFMNGLDLDVYIVHKEFDFVGTFIEI